MKLFRCVIVRDPMEKIVREIFAHELPILQAMHGESAVVIEEEIEASLDRDPSSEYQRLEGLYGLHPEAGVPWVQVVYGLEMEGRLAKAMGGRSVSSGAVPDEMDYESFTAVELRALLDERGVEVPSRASKGELVALAKATA